MKGFNQLLLAAVLLFSVKNVSAQNQTVRLKSPDNRLTLTISSADSRLVYDVKAGAAEILKQSTLGLTIDGIDLGANAKITASPTRTFQAALTARQHGTAMTDSCQF